MIEETLQLAAALAREAGEFLKGRLTLSHTVKRKSGPADLVTEADLGAERIIMEGIQRQFPEHSIISEEAGANKKESGCLWLVDPLDGTMNYTHGLPLYTVSIAFLMEGVAHAGVVFDPERDELYSAAKGRGANMNSQPLGVSATGSMKDGLLATGFPTSVREDADPHLTLFAGFLKRARGVRRLGSAAMDLCYVAQGRLDGFWELGLSSWDVAAAALIVEEAGGRVTDFSGGRDFLWGREVAASNGLIHGELLEVVRPCAGKGDESP